MELPPHEILRLRAVADSDAHLEALVQARQAGEPLQYLEGTAPFGPLDLVVDERVLIPRPETEQLWELAMHLVPRPAVAVDLCTGSGALALGIKQASPTTEVWATELSAEAVEVAGINAASTGLEISVVEGDLFSPLPAALEGRVDLVVSNPPYVAEQEWAGLPVDVKREPRLALVAGPTGLEILGRIAFEAHRWLAPSGWVAVEIGETQGEAVREMFERDLGEVEVRSDLTGRVRFVIGRRR